MSSSYISKYNLIFINFLQIAPSATRLRDVRDMPPRRPSPPPSPTTAAVDSILREINAQCYSHELVVKLFQAMKNQFEGNFLPCQLNKDDPKHRYHSCGGRLQFHIRCAICKHSLMEQEALRYFAQLIHEGTVNRSVIGLGSTGALTTNVSEEHAVSSLAAPATCALC